MSPERLGIWTIMDALLAWLIERLGPRAVSRTANVIALVCGLATAAFVVVLVVLLVRR
jgi:hypothetical protein